MLGCGLGDGGEKKEYAGAVVSVLNNAKYLFAVQVAGFSNSNNDKQNEIL